MNSISNDALKANCATFTSRFPGLSALLGLDRPEGIAALLSALPEDFFLAPSASGCPTLSVHGSFLHSRYDPLRDAARELDRMQQLRAGERTPSSQAGCVFAGIGLGFLPELYASRFPDATVVLVEPDLFIFILMLASRPLDALLSHRALIILAGTQAREVVSFMETTDLSDLAVHEPPALTAPNRPWFDEFDTLRKRNREKKEINENTLRRFGDLWLSNMCRNLSELRNRPGIGAFGGIFSGMSVLVLAAGPSLDRILPDLKRLRERCVIIAVDTAARACVRAGVEPDFIVLVDPQYWNWRHLDTLACPKSVLITESAAWPAVFRFPCRAICLCSSLFPLGKFLEDRTGARGELGAGGSVSTTAWDFARFLGSTDIVMAGLDLGFPARKTHFTGSIFEERTHTASSRLSPAEGAGYLALYGAGPYPVSDYRGNPVLTDKRLILYAWWFESRLASNPECKTGTLTPEGVRIPGFSVLSVEDLAARPAIRDGADGIDDRLTKALRNAQAPDGNLFDQARRDLKDALEDIRSHALEGKILCDSFLENAQKGMPGDGGIFGKLDAIDRKIIGHPAKEVAAMVFSAASVTKGREGSGGGPDNPIWVSRELYRGIVAAAEKNIVML